MSRPFDLPKGWLFYFEEVDERAFNPGSIFWLKNRKVDRLVSIN